MQGATAVIVDDDPSVRRGLRRLLLSAGYDVVVCSSAEEFLALDHLARPACVLLDIRMPGMTGLDLQRALTRAGREIPIVMSSGHADAFTVARARAAGAIAFLSKPFDDVQLFEALQAGIERDRARLQSPGAPARAASSQP